MNGAADLAARHAARALSRIIDPRGGPSPGRLRHAIAGRVVLITGSSYGIGEASARRLGAAGATVLLVARSADRLQHLRGEIGAAGGAAFAYPADLREPDQVDRLAQAILTEHGDVDVLVSNAGKSIRRSLASSHDRPHDFERTIDVNYLGPVRLLLALLPSMRRRADGHVINVSTIGVRGLPPAPRWAAYQASKAAFDFFLRCAAPELQADGIAITSVYMTLVHTRMSAPTSVWRYVPGMLPEEAAELICRAIVERPRVIGPWWQRPAELTATALAGPVEALLGVAYRVTDRSGPRE